MLVGREVWSHTSRSVHVFIFSPDETSGRPCGYLMCSQTTRLLKGHASCPRSTFLSWANSGYMISKSSSNFIILRLRRGAVFVLLLH